VPGGRNPPIAPPLSQSCGRFHGIELVLSGSEVAHPLKNTSVPANSVLRKTIRIAFTEFASLN
jgi:hypothetical protein